VTPCQSHRVGCADSSARARASSSRSLDEREHLALLQAHVRGQLRAEKREHARIRRRCRDQRVGAVADHRVLAERSQHQRIVRISMAGVGGEQQLLLEPEVQTSMLGPESEKRRASVSGSRIRRAPEPLGDHERMVMVARERGQGVRPLHRDDHAGVMPKRQSRRRARAPPPP
jgi:hypothetical protein